MSSDAIHKQCSLFSNIIFAYLAREELQELKLIIDLSQEPRNAAIPLDLDDDTVSVQSQETDKQPDTSSSISKTSSDSKESTPKLAEKQEVKEPSVDKTTPEQEKKVTRY